MDAELGETRDVLGGHVLQMGERHLDFQLTQLATSLLHRVQRLSRRPIAHGVQVQIQSHLVQLRDESRELFGFEEHTSTNVGSRCVRLQRPTRQNFVHAVEVNLDGVEDVR